MDAPNPTLPKHLSPCLKQIDTHKVISFDIFDTVLLRPVAVPNHLFWMMEKEVQALLRDYLFEFRNIRIEAESLARQYAFHQEEITLEQIYSAFAELTGVDVAIVDTIKQKELALEHQHCSAHPHTKILYDHAIASGKQVVFTSDMYLPEYFVRELLEKNGFYTENHPIFLSSVLLKTKHHGTVYPYLVSQLQCKPSDILHIGDNKISDIKQAKRAGLGTFYIPRSTERFFENKRNCQIWHNEVDISDIGMSLVIGHLAHYYGIKKPELLETTEEPITATWYEFGYHIAGVLFLGFSQWLLNELHSKAIDKAYFFSRDGKIIREAFNLVAPYYDKKIDSSYLYASRRILQVARIRKMDTMALFYLATSKSELPVGEYLARIGMEPDEHVEAMKKAGFSGKGHLIVSEDDKRKLAKLFRLIEPSIVAYAAKEREDALGYYLSEGLGDSKRHAFVDIGWNGMMVSALADILGKQPDELSGFFLGSTVHARNITERGFPLSAYLFNLGEQNGRCQAIHQSMEVVELLFSATHGSVTGFKDNNGNYVPVLDAIDCSQERIEAITALQQGALDFINAVVPVLAKCPKYTLPPNLAMQPLYAILMNPTKAEATMFCSIIHVQDIGATQKGKMIVQRPPSAFYLLFRPFSFVKYYQQAYWKRGFCSMMGRPSRTYFHTLERINSYIQTNPLLFRFKRLVGHLVKV